MSAAVSFFIFFIFISPTTGQPLTIQFHAPNLYPEGLAYDPSAHHFIVGSLRNRSFLSVSYSGDTNLLISDQSLPPNTSILGLALDPNRNRLLAVIHSTPPHPPFNALAAYDLRSADRIFLTLLPHSAASRAVANAVAVDPQGNAYVTNSRGYSDGNYIWKVDLKGEASIFSRSPVFNDFPVDRDAPFSYCGLNGIAYVEEGYLLVVQSNTGKMFRVEAEDGAATAVELSEDLPMADGIAIRRDGVVLVVSHKKVWYIRSEDSWGKGKVVGEIGLEEEKFATSVVVEEEGRAYVVYGRVQEGMAGKFGNGRDCFEIQEVVGTESSKYARVWFYVLLALSSAYLFYWRFQTA